MKFSRRQLILLARKLEPPKCGCRIVKRPMCLLFTDKGCDERQQYGHCDCPYLPGKPCEHVLNHRVSLSLAEIATILADAYPNQYVQAPEDPEPMNAQDRETRVALMSLRVSHGYSPFKDRDKISMRGMAIFPNRLRNGRDGKGNQILPEE